MGINFRFSWITFALIFTILVLIGLLIWIFIFSAHAPGDACIQAERDIIAKSLPHYTKEVLAGADEGDFWYVQDVCKTFFLFLNEKTSNVRNKEDAKKLKQNMTTILYRDLMSGLENRIKTNPEKEEQYQEAIALVESILKNHLPEKKKTGDLESARPSKKD